MANNYRYSYERYMELRLKARTLGLSCREAAEYDYQRRMFSLSVVVAPTE